MVSKTRYIIRHRLGHFINLRYEPVKEIDKAARFGTEEEANHFYRDSHYKAVDPENYTVLPMKITYELESVEYENSES
ncbi:hypothetical protein JCM16163A_41400 [Paenibacillus sp. YK5]